MRRRTVFTELLDDDGPEIDFEHEPYSDILQAKVADKYVVAYLVHDSEPLNPLKEWDGNGELITENQHVITDGNAHCHLGLEELGGRFHDCNKNYDLDGIGERVESKLKALITANEALRVWYVKLRLELDCEPMPYLIDEIQSYRTDIEWDDVDSEMLEKLPSWETLAEEAWDELYAEGKIGTYLAVPVNYCDNNHGPGTTSIYTTDIDNANAVWIPGENELDNMNFTGCTTYAEKLAVADKYAQSCLDEYTKWCNGEVYGCVVQVHEEDGELVNEDSCWGFIGYEYAEETLKEEFFEPACERVQTEHDIDVHTQCGRQQEMTL